MILERTKLYGREAVKIKATLIEEEPKRWHLEINGVKKWFSKYHCKFKKHNDTAIIQEWLYNKEFPDE